MYYLARRLRDLGHRITVAGIWDRSQDYDNEGIRIVTVKTSGNMLAQRRDFHRWLEADAQNSSTNLVEVPDFDGMLPFRFRACPVVVRLHLPGTAIALDKLRPLHPIRYFCERETLRRHPDWIAVSKLVARLTKKLFVLKPRNSAVIHNNFAPPVTVQPESAMVESLRQEHGDFIVYVGQVSNRKGAVALAHAARYFLPQLAGLQLVYIGPDTLHWGHSTCGVIRSHLGSLASRVIFTGGLPHQAVIGWLAAAARAFALPSRLEAFAIAPIEAMHARVPVIFTSRASGPELINDGRTVLLVNPARPREIAEAVVRVIRDRAFATRLAEQAFEMVQTRFALDTCIQATLAFYEEVCLAAKRGS